MGLAGFQKLKAEIDVLYNCDCGHDHGYKLDGGTNTQLAKQMAAMLEDIWKKQGMPKTIDKTVTRSFAKKLFSGITDGYGSGFAGIDYDTPDFRMLQNLERSVYAFSGAKNYQQMKAITEALVGEDGKLRTFSEFKDIAQGINETHLSWLKIEYDTAITSGQMAGKWVDFQNNADSHPLLKYDAIIDGRTSDICADFNDTILPIDDSFWDSYYPPNHFNCRSTVLQISDGEVTDKSGIVVSDRIPNMFKVNLAKEGLAFPAKSPYFIGCPDSVLKQSMDLVPKRKK